MMAIHHWNRIGWTMARADPCRFAVLVAKLRVLAGDDGGESHHRYITRSNVSAQSAASASVGGMTQQSTDGESVDQYSRYITEAEVARRTTLSVRGLQELRRKGEGAPFTKIGKRILYRWSDVEAWLEANKSTKETDQ